MNPIQALQRCGVSTVYEAAGRRGLIDVPLLAIIPGSSVAGRARTVACGQDDNLMVHAALSVVQPGEVLVVGMPEPRPVALVGELIAVQAAHREVAGILVDAAVRDVIGLAEVGLPVWARWVRATGASKDAVGRIGGPIVVGGQQIATGDVVVLDADGAVAVRASEVEEVAEAALARLQKESEARHQYRQGALAFDLLGLRSKVEPPAERGR